MDWGMKYFDDPVIRYIVINGGHTAAGVQCHVCQLSLALFWTGDLCLCDSLRLYIYYEIVHKVHEKE